MKDKSTLKYVTVSDEEKIQMLRDFHAKYGRWPESTDCKTYGLPHCTTYIARFGSWRNALRLAGYERPKKDDPKFFEPNSPQYSKEELLNDLRDLAKKLGYRPRVRDLTSDMVSDFTYRRYFGSWSNALVQAGIEKDHRHNHYTDSELISLLAIFMRENKRLPYSKEMNNAHGFPSTWTYIKRFGSLKRAVELAAKMNNES